MKLLKIGAIGAVLATMSLVGCSSGDKTPAASDSSSSISFHLKTSNGVEIDAVNYDLTTDTGAEVISSSIPVPGNDSATGVPLLGISALGAGNYVLDLKATSADSKYVCDSGKVGFTLSAGQTLTLPTINLQCSTTVEVDNSGSVLADVNITTSQQTVGSVIETFSYGPRSVNGVKNGTTCDFSGAHVALNVANADAAIAYSWSASPDGDFTLNAKNTQGTYNCKSGGTKTLTLTGVKGGQTSTKQVSVVCSDAPCNFVCGNGILEGTEQCDEATPRCEDPTTGVVDCKITPVCGDNKIDAPETCEPPNTATCDASCHTVVVTPKCGDGSVNQASEQCDNGSLDSDTTPNACRTNCTNPKCGDGVVDTGEQCDAASLPTATCDATCKTITAPPPPKHVACIACMEANSVVGPGIQAVYVDPDAKALTVEQCVIDQNCFNPVAAACYCGPTDTSGATDLAVCSTAAFQPTGPCLTSIKAAAAPGATNDDITSGLFDFNNSVGAAMGTLNDVLSLAPECVSKCF